MSGRDFFLEPAILGKRQMSNICKTIYDNGQQYMDSTAAITFSALRIPVILREITKRLPIIFRMSKPFLAFLAVKALLMPLQKPQSLESLILMVIIEMPIIFSSLGPFYLFFNLSCAVIFKTLRGPFQLLFTLSCAEDA